MVNEFQLTNHAHTPAHITEDNDLQTTAKLRDSNGNPITAQNPLNTTAQVSVTTEEFIGYDNIADTYFTITNAGETNDTIQVLIDQSPVLVDVTSILTATEANDEAATAALVVSDLNSDNTFNTYFEAKSLNTVVFIYSKFIAEKGEYSTFNDFQIVIGGSATPLTIVSIASGFENIQRRFKRVLIEPDAYDNRYGRIGVFGQVGTVTKADNPINISVRRSVSTLDQQVFADKTVPATQVWYIEGVAVADDVGGEFAVWEGDERDRVETFNADGTLFTHTLDHSCLESEDYHSVLVNDAGSYSEGSDYVIEDCPTDETKSQIRWINNPTKPDNGDTVKVTYDKLIRRVGLFVRADSTQEYHFAAPLKLEPGDYVIATVNQRSANSAIVIVNLSGFFESKVII